MTLEVHGTGELKALSKRLKEAGRKDLRKEMLAAFQVATKPLKAAALHSAASVLPRRGGLNQYVASSKLATRTSAARVRITAKSRKGGTVNVALLDRGTVRHPVFGHRDRWVSQSVAPGWFSKPMEAGAPAVRAALTVAMKDVARKIEAR